VGDLLVEQRAREERREEETLRRRERDLAKARRQFAEDHQIAQRVAEVWFVDDARAYSVAPATGAEELEPARAEQVRAESCARRPESAAKPDTCKPCHSPVRQPKHSQPRT